MSTDEVPGNDATPLEGRHEARDRSYPRLRRRPREGVLREARVAA